MFSVLIPTWNNLEYLKLCVDGLRRHSRALGEILVHINDGSDGTLQWVREQGLPYTHSSGNIGVCLALNWVAAEARQPWLIFLNDDMFVTPGWDTALAAAVQGARGPQFVSSLLIEPRPTSNKLVHFANFGEDVASFDEAALLRFAAAPSFADRAGVASQPTAVARRDWNMVGGYSIEFSPGMSSDDDFLMKLWLIGCRSYRIVGTSLVYHFACKSTGRIRRNRGGREFLLKWGITQKAFKRDYLQASAADGAALANVPRSPASSRLKRAGYAAGPYPLGDFAAWDSELPGRLAPAADEPSGG
jgi:GT2 family glycosyltransferase